MAILRVAQIGHPVLRLVAEPVDPAEIAADVWQQLFDDLLETMEDYDGAGLAAPQVHVSARVVALTLDPDVGPQILINPEITTIGDALAQRVEGCLSIEGMRAVVRRPAHIRVSFLDRDGARHVYELQGLPAVVVQHECDHLDGVLYIDRADLKTLAFLSEFERFGRLDHVLTEAVDDGRRADSIVVIEAPNGAAVPQRFVDLEEG
ncbi:MAG: hypothetical protein RLZZ383_373 [Pseudomonadota bacterium]